MKFKGGSNPTNKYRPFQEQFYLFPLTPTKGARATTPNIKMFYQLLFKMLYKSDQHDNQDRLSINTISNQKLSTDIQSSTSNNQNEFKMLLEKIDLLRQQCQRAEQEQINYQEEFLRKEDLYKQVILTLEEKLEHRMRGKKTSKIELSLTDTQKQFHYGSQKFFDECKSLLQENEHLRRQVLQLCNELVQKVEIQERVNRDLEEFQKFTGVSPISKQNNNTNYFSPHSPKETQQVDFFEKYKQQKTICEAIKQKLQLVVEVNHNLQLQNITLETQLKETQLRANSQQLIIKQRELSPTQYERSNSPSFTKQNHTVELYKQKNLKKLADEKVQYELKFKNEFQNTQNLEQALKLKQAQWDAKEIAWTQKIRNIEATMDKKDKQLHQQKIKLEVQTQYTEQLKKAQNTIEQLEKNLNIINKQHQIQLRQFIQQGKEQQKLIEIKLNLEQQNEIYCKEKQQQQVLYNQIEQYIKQRINYYRKLANDNQSIQAPIQETVISPDRLIQKLNTVYEEEDDEIDSSQDKIEEVDNEESEILSQISIGDNVFFKSIEILEQTIKKFEVDKVDEKRFLESEVFLSKIKLELAEKEEVLIKIQRELRQEKAKNRRNEEYSEFTKIQDLCDQLQRDVKIASNALDDRKVDQQVKEERIDQCKDNYDALQRLYLDELSSMNKELSNRFEFSQIELSHIDSILPDVRSLDAQPEVQVLELQKEVNNYRDKLFQIQKAYLSLKSSSDLNDPRIQEQHKQIEQILQTL